MHERTSDAFLFERFILLNTKYNLLSKQFFISLKIYHLLINLSKFLVCTYITCLLPTLPHSLTVLFQRLSSGSTGLGERVLCVWSVWNCVVRILGAVHFRLAVAASVHQQSREGLHHQGHWLAINLINY